MFKSQLQSTFKIPLVKIAGSIPVYYPIKRFINSPVAGKLKTLRHKTAGMRLDGLNLKKQFL